MMGLSTKRLGVLATAAVLAPCLAAAGCGGGQSSTAARAPQTVATVAAKPTVAVAAATPHLRILAPAPGASTGQAVTIRVRLSGASPRGAHPFRYVLDRVLRRAGAAQLTLSELAPGRHHLVVELSGSPHVRATTSFTVLAPATVAQPASSEPMTGGSQPAATAPKAATPAPTHTSPERTSSEHPSGEHTEHTSPPPAPEASEGAIPQGGAGDHDGDNSGGPSDGDGNV
jgi:hypothetical protein